MTRGGTFSWPSIAIGLLTVSAAPARGSSMGTSAPLFTICSSVRMSSSVATTPKTMPLVSRIRRHSAQSFVAKTSSRIATSARTLVRRVATVAKRGSVMRSARSIQRAKASQCSSAPVIVIRNQRPSRHRYRLASALAASSRAGRVGVRAPHRMP